VSPPQKAAHTRRRSLSWWLIHKPCLQTSNHPAWLPIDHLCEDAKCAPSLRKGVKKFTLRVGGSLFLADRTGYLGFPQSPFTFVPWVRLSEFYHYSVAQVFSTWHESKSFGVHFTTQTANIIIQKVIERQLA